MINKLRSIKSILFDKLKTTFYPIGEFDCSVCGSKNVQINPFPVSYLVQYHKYQNIHNPFFSETINFEHYSCANCGASDRDRLYGLYLNEYFKRDLRKIKFLDIAPADALRSFIKRFTQVHYRSMDLMMDDVDDKLDITNMDAYQEGQFDFFICSHVLEHIPDDLKAMHELFRVLKNGGKGIVMVPINLQLQTTLEDPNCTDIAKRWKYFGQDDHIRMYAKADFIHRLESVGFSVEQLGEDYFGKDTFIKNAIFSTSVLYIVNK